jgi:tetratricopeptide (TPR) repeat protein
LEPEVSNYLNQLSRLLLQNFSQGDLIQLAFELGINVEDLPAVTRLQLARELVTYCYHTSCLLNLLNTLRQQRPSTDWPAISEVVYLASLPPAERLQQATNRADVPEPVLSLPPGSRLLLRRNPFFTGRLTELRALAQAIFGGGTAVITQSAAITGLGGVGKSQLAVEFAYRYGRYFAGGVFWLSFTDPTSIAGEIIACGGSGGLDLPGLAALSFPDQVERVQAAWRETTPRLLIFDNCEDPSLFDKYTPASGGCCVLVTSRNQHWESMPEVKTHPLGILPRAESVTLLRRHLHTVSDSDANAIANELGDLPLALHLASSYLATYKSATTPAAFLAELRATSLAHPALQGRSSLLSTTRHELSLEYTFQLSYSRLKLDERPEDPLALTLLQRAACLAPGELLPRDLLLALVPPNKAKEGVAVEHATRPVSSDIELLVFEDALRRLAGLGLLELADNEVFRLHRLLARFVIMTNPDYTTTYQATQYSVTVITDNLNKAGYPLRLLPWLPHLRHLAAQTAGREDNDSAYLHYEIGYLLQNLGDYATARSSYKRAHAIWESVLGTNHHNTAASLRQLGTACWYLGRYTEARVYWEQSLHICQRINDRHGEAKALNNLSLVSMDQGDYSAGKEYLVQALPIFQEVGHRWAECMALNNLGALSRRLGDYEQARLLLEQALHICREIDNRQTESMILSNLSSTAYYLGDSRAALTYSQEAIFISRQIGARHDLADALTFQGHALTALGQLVEAAEAYQQTLELRNDLGELTLAWDARAGLARVLMEQGQLNQALTEVEEILHFLQGQTVQANDDPFWIYVTCYQILQAAKDSRADNILKEAYDLLQELASRINDEVLQQSYLERVPSHHQIIAAWEE